MVWLGQGWELRGWGFLLQGLCKWALATRFVSSENTSFGTAQGDVYMEHVMFI